MASLHLAANAPPALIFSGVIVIKRAKPIVIASIGGSDSSAGAGIQGDIKTAMAMGAWCHTAITAVTAQTPSAVEAVTPLATAEVIAQLNALDSAGAEFSPQAFKTGMLARVELLSALAAFFRRTDRPVVIDTVMSSTSGVALADAHFPQGLLRELAPLASLLTPNLPEAAALLECETAQTPKEMYAQVDELMQSGVKAVLLKGGHLPGGTALDLLATKSGVEAFSSDKIATTHTHGSGCALATAITVGLAQGLALADAVAQAREYVRKFIQNASDYTLVKHNGPLVHFKL